MFEIEKLPGYIRAAAEDGGIRLDDVYLTSHCDMDREHIYCDTYLIATSDSLYVLSGTVGLSSRENHVKGGLDATWNQSDFRAYPLSELSDFKVEELLSGARFTAKNGAGEYVFITAMSNFCKNSTLLFIKYLNKIKRGELTDPGFSVEPEDDPKALCCPKCGMRYPDRNRKKSIN